MEVPLVLVGDPKQVTVNGGMVEQRLMLLSVEVRPDAIPNEIEVDISEMELDDSILVGDLALPAGSVALTEPDEMVVSSELTRAALVGDEDETEGEGDGEAAEGEASDEATAADTEE